MSQETVHVIIENGRTGQTWEGDFESSAGTRYELHCEIFCKFNRTTTEDADWLDSVGYHLPSLSVGDVFTWSMPVYPGVENRVRVLPIGFELLPLTPKVVEEIPSDISEWGEKDVRGAYAPGTKFLINGLEVDPNNLVPLSEND